MKPKIIVTLLTFVFLAVSAAGGADGRPLLLAHRGANLEADEDTLHAYSIACDYGVDLLETDVRLTSDGHWVIMHDPILNRTTGHGGIVAKMTLAEIKAIKTIHGEPIPTLEELLDLAKSRGVMIYLDMKVNPHDWAAFIKLLDEHGMKSKVIIGIYWVKAEREVESRWPEVITSFSWPQPVPNLKFVKKLGADYVGTLNQFATKRFIRKAHRMGLKVVTMPVDSVKKLEKQRAIGLDILQTNDPRLFQKMGLLPKKSASLPEAVGANGHSPLREVTNEVVGANGHSPLHGVTNEAN